MELGKVIKCTITIEPSSNNGFIVKIGCGKFVAQDKDVLLKDLSEYLKNPEAWEMRYNEIAGDVPEEARPERPRLRDLPARATEGGMARAEP